jgi:hypothetical protein
MDTVIFYLSLLVVVAYGCGLGELFLWSGDRSMRSLHVFYGQRLNGWRIWGVWWKRTWFVGVSVSR